LAPNALQIKGPFEEKWAARADIGLGAALGAIFGPAYPFEQTQTDGEDLGPTLEMLLLVGVKESRPEKLYYIFI
jgi:hypothetical protein